MPKKRKLRVRSSIDARLNAPVGLRPTSLAIPVIMNDELRDMQAEIRQKKDDLCHS